MAFAALTGEVPPVAWWLLAANLFWVMVYDTMYAMADREDDLAIGVRSTAILFGRYDRFIVGLCQLCTLALLAAIGYVQELNGYFFGGLAVMAVFFLYHQWLIKDRERGR